MTLGTVRFEIDGRIMRTLRKIHSQQSTMQQMWKNNMQRMRKNGRRTPILPSLLQQNKITVQASLNGYPIYPLPSPISSKFNPFCMLTETTHLLLSEN
jgi:hypothetical protein